MELRLDGDRHLKYFRMSAEQMDELLSVIGPELARQYKLPSSHRTQTATCNYTEVLTDTLGDLFGIKLCGCGLFTNSTYVSIL